MKSQIILCILLVNVLLIIQMISAKGFDQGSLIENLVLNLKVRDLRSKILDLNAEKITKRKQPRFGRYGHFIGKRFYIIENSHH